jgi:hypothetical protein
MYRAITTGWIPPETLGPEEYARAKGLPDTDPLKAFAGFAVSFRGKYFGGWAGDPAKAGNCSDPVGGQSRELVRMVHSIATKGFEFRHMSFFDVLPQKADMVIYCDPPYWGTTQYCGAEFSHKAFIERVWEWASYCPVFVSEYSFPLGLEVLRVDRALSMVSVGRRRLEKLFLVRR